MITALLIVHGLLAVFMLGALTHQTLSVWRPAAAELPAHRGAIARFSRASGAGSYANTAVILYC